IVDPVISDNGWKFSDKPECISDTVNSADYLWQIYVKADPNYTGRVTVPVLWDKQSGKIVNTELFTALEHWEGILGQQSYLCGDRITIADWSLFTTLFRFDLAYYGLFKCNLKRLIDFPNLWNYCRKLYQYPGVRFSVGEANANGL
uniref:glutathione S-transferase C-terminal domain-containing protein n=1 Tax=Chamaesiphon sp. OTE_20_metabat_361 TaxID=2964689 RepID=UPI00286C3ACC